MKKAMSIPIFIVFLFIGISSRVLCAEYVAFSLKVAQKQITESHTGQIPSEVFNLGDITKVIGLVYDRQTNDTILVGQKYTDRAELTIDDFCVTLRARFVYNEWPLVSIDPKTDSQKTRVQQVRFEGGIENTKFGKDLFDADYRLKQIGMGIRDSEIPAVKSYWDLFLEKVKKQGLESNHVSSRFWFFPILPMVAVRKDVVDIKQLKIGVFTEALSAEADRKRIENSVPPQDTAGSLFAEVVSDNFDSLAREHLPFLRMQGLSELVALTRAVEEMQDMPDFSFWIRDYHITKIDTPKTVDMLNRQEKYNIPTKDGLTEYNQVISGGAQLKAIALRIKAGDVTALRDAVLQSRPRLDALSWNFVVAQWVIPLSSELLKVQDVVPLLQQAAFLEENKHYEDAITLYEKVIQLQPNLPIGYIGRGAVYHLMDMYDKAISDYDKALAINDLLAGVYNNRGAAYNAKESYEAAISDLNRALEINPNLFHAYNNLGIAYGDLSKKFGKESHKKPYFNDWENKEPNMEVNEKLVAYIDKAIAEYDKAIEIESAYVQAYYNRGIEYTRKGYAVGDKGLIDNAIADFKKALSIESQLAVAHWALASAYGDKGLYDNSIAHFNRALKIRPLYAQAYYGSGATYKKRGDMEEAIANFKKALEIDPNLANIYNDHEEVLHDVSIKRNAYIGLLLGFDISNNTAYSSEFYAPINSTYFQSSLDLQGSYSISETVSARFRLPFLGRFGFVGEQGALPGLYDFETNFGPGDFWSSVSWNILDQRQGSLPLNLGIQVGGVAPTGKSRFHQSIEPGWGRDSYVDEPLPLGNGFWILSFGAGISRFVSEENTSLYGNITYLKRFSRNLTYHISASEGYAGLYPGNIPIIGIGALSIVKSDITLGNIILVEKGSRTGVELQLARVGEIRFIEPSFIYGRLGFKLVGTAKYGQPPTGFLGLEFVGKEEYNGDNIFFVIKLDLPFRWQLFGHNFYLSR